MYKECNKCLDDKTYQQFRVDKRRKDGRESICRECRSKAVRKWRAENPGARRESDIERLYNITIEEAKAQLKKQGGKCPLCSVKLTKKNHNIDHCHTTKKFRGILCNTCNLGIGHFERFQKHGMEKVFSYLTMDNI